MDEVKAAPAGQARTPAIRCSWVRIEAVLHGQAVLLSGFSDQVELQAVHDWVNHWLISLPE